MRRALLAVLAGALAYLVIGALRLTLETGSPFGLDPTLLVDFMYPAWLWLAIGVVQSAQATLPALLGGWLWGATSHPGRMAALVGLMIALTGSVAQYALFCMKYSCHSPVEDSLFQIFLPIAQASIAAAVAAYAGMRLRRRSSDDSSMLNQ